MVNRTDVEKIFGQSIDTTTSQNPTYISMIPISYEITNNETVFMEALDHLK